MKNSYSRLFRATLFIILTVMLFSNITVFAGTKNHSKNNRTDTTTVTTPATTVTPTGIDTTSSTEVPATTTTDTTASEVPATTVDTTTPSTDTTTVDTTTPSTDTTTTTEPITIITTTETTPESITTETTETITTTAAIVDAAPSVTGIYYVSNDGSNSNSGSFSRPLKTIQAAVDQVSAGQTVAIRGGTYNERVILNSSGKSTAYITITNFEDEQVTIDGTGIDWGYDWACLFNLNSQKYIKVNGLRVINSRWAGIGSVPDSNGCEYVIIQNCETYNTQSSGITFFTGSHITIDGNSVERACVKENGSQEGISLATIDTFVIKNNHVFNFTNAVQSAGGEGIDAKNGCTNGKIYGNTVNDIAKIGIYVDAYSLTQKNIEVYDNTVYNCDQGITVATEHNGALIDVNIHDNVVKNCVWGMAIGGWNTGYTHYMNNIIFDNNTVTGSKLVAMYLDNPEAINVHITNNVLAGGSSCAPIYLATGTLAQITIDANTLSTIVKGQPTGTNYTLM